jgi:uncharacterized membrane protein YdjX (TVP38/TMEM64 family)
MQENEQFSVWGLMGTFAILFALAFFIDLSAVKDWVIAAGAWAPLLFVLLKISTIVFPPLSGGPLYLLVGLFFGFWPGILYVAVADFIGFTTAFSISRLLGQKVVERIISQKEGGVIHRIVNHVSTPKGFFQAYLTLFSMPELLAYGAGLTKIKYKSFISILSPLSFVLSSIIVLFGSVLDVSKNAGFITFIFPALGMVVFMTGGWLFMKAVNRK